MLHVHTRWAAALGNWNLDAVGGVPKSITSKGTYDWGQVWISDREDSPGELETPWRTTPGEPTHAVAVYEVDCHTASGDQHVIGVASPDPVDTAGFMAQLEKRAREAGVSLGSIRTSLSNESIASLASKVQVTNFREESETTSRITQFRYPVSPGELEKVEFSSIGLVLESDKQVYLSMFDDNQFFVANEDPAEVGRLASMVSSLWIVSNDNAGLG